MVNQKNPKSTYTEKYVDFPEQIILDPKTFTIMFNVISMYEKSYRVGLIIVAIL